MTSEYLSEVFNANYNFGDNQRVMDEKTFIRVVLELEREKQLTQYPFFSKLQQEIEGLKKECVAVHRERSQFELKTIQLESELFRIREGVCKLPIYKTRLFDNNLEFNVCRVVDLDNLLGGKG